MKIISITNKKKTFLKSCSHYKAKFADEFHVNFEKLPKISHVSNFNTIFRTSSLINVYILEKCYFVRITN